MRDEFPLYNIDFDSFFDTKTIFSRNHLNGGHRLAYIGNIGCVVGYITKSKETNVHGKYYNNLAIGIASSRYDLSITSKGNIFYEKAILRNIALARAMFEPLQTFSLSKNENDIFDWLKIHNPEYIVNNKACRTILRYIDGADDYLYYSSHIIWEKFNNNTITRKVFICEG